MAMFLFPGVISCYMSIIFAYVFKKDTPYWLGINGRQADSLEILEYIYTEIGLESARCSLETDVNENQAKEEKETVSYKKLFYSKKYRKMMRLGCLLNLTKQLSGNGAILFYSSFILNKNGHDQFLFVAG